MYKLSDAANVYDLTIADCHEFVAAGVIVHNSWAAHWLLPEISSPPASQTSPAEVILPTGADAMIRNESGTGFLDPWN